MTRLGDLAPLSLLLMASTVLISGVSSDALWNAALCKPTEMDSKYGYGANRAVDGKRDPSFHGGSCIHTRSTGIVPKWWIVDLEAEYLVYKVVITNRDEWLDRTNNLTIGLFVTDPKLSPVFPNNSGTVCAQIPGTLPPGTSSLPCVTPTWSRYVKVTKFSLKPMHFCEVEVMVSQKRDEPNKGLAFQQYRRFHNSAVQQDGAVIMSARTNSPLACSVMCIKNEIECTAFQWTEDTKGCQLLSINPDSYGPLSTIAGTDLYVRKPIQC